MARFISVWTSKSGTAPRRDFYAAMCTCVEKLIAFLAPSLPPVILLPFPSVTKRILWCADQVLHIPWKMGINLTVIFDRPRQLHVPCKKSPDDTPASQTPSTHLVLLFRRHRVFARTSQSRKIASYENKTQASQRVGKVSIYQSVQIVHRFLLTGSGPNVIAKVGKKQEVCLSYNMIVKVST